MKSNIKKISRKNILNLFSLKNKYFTLKIWEYSSTHTTILLRSFTVISHKVLALRNAARNALLPLYFVALRA